MEDIHVEIQGLVEELRRGIDDPDFSSSVADLLDLQNAALIVADLLDELLCQLALDAASVLPPGLLAKLAEERDD